VSGSLEETKGNYFDAKSVPAGVWYQSSIWLMLVDVSGCHLEPEACLHTVKQYLNFGGTGGRSVTNRLNRIN